jgi:competence protein ComEC
MPTFHDPFFKVLSKSDSGQGRNNIAGVLIPLSSRSYFPPLMPPATRGGLYENRIVADLVLADGRRERIETRYSLQHPGRTNGETRITGGLKPLRAASREGDIMLFERGRTASAAWRISLLKKGGSDYIRAVKLARGRRYGVLDGWNGNHPPFEPGLQGATPNGWYRYRPLPERRSFIARLDRIDAIGQTERMSWEFDGFDERFEETQIDRAFSDPAFLGPFALLQVTAGIGELAKHFGLDASEGAWVEIEVDRGSPRAPLQARIAQLAANGYTDEYRGIVTAIRLLSPPGEALRPFPEIGASVAPSIRKYRKVKARSSLPSGAKAGSNEILKILQPAYAKAALVQVRDVGQASFATLLADDGSELAHYDAGWPISYNGHTVPANLPVASSVPVILSHWDWDHLHAWHSVPELRSSCWVVPRQDVGPGAARVANALHAKKRLKVYSGKTMAMGTSTLIRCSGTSGLNDTGLALGLELANGSRVLLIGDADYLACTLPPGWAACDGLIVTHHGVSSRVRRVISRTMASRASVARSPRRTPNVNPSGAPRPTAPAHTTRRLRRPWSATIYPAHRRSRISRCAPAG